ncbi:MAG TPA: hypothetical protein VFC96_04805 [Anaerovoracaceae bacterium]|nr:hypothetical protein [Anaerovoracaceae bacterium]
MKGYSNLFLLPFILIICFTLFSGFSIESEQTMVERLLEERKDILHKVYFRQIDEKMGETLLYEIETQPLLTSDIRSLREYADTDMDVVEGMEILALEKVTDLYGRKSFRGDILWHMLGHDGKYVQSVEYSIVIEKAGTGCKLSEFRTIAP